MWWQANCGIWWDTYEAGAVLFTAGGENNDEGLHTAGSENKAPEVHTAGSENKAPAALAMHVAATSDRSMKLA